MQNISNIRTKSLFRIKEVTLESLLWIIGTIITITSIMIISFGSLQTSASQSQEVIIKPYKVGKYDFFEVYKAVGQIKFSQSQYVSSKKQSTVEYVTALQGQKVKEGDIIISFSEKMAEQNLLKAKADFKSVESSYKRDLSLSDKKIISQEVLNKSKVDLERSKLDLVSAQEELEDFVVRAPFEGIIGVLRVRVGDKINVGDMLFTIIKPSPKEIIVDLPPNLSGKVDESTEIYTSDLSGNKVIGKIIATSQYLSGSGTFAAKIEFDKDTQFIHDSFVEITIIYDTHEALSIPEKAVLKNNTGNFVYKVNNENIVDQVYVKLGTRTDNNIEIVSDEIKLGDRIVLEGLTKVYEGLKVKDIADLDEIEAK